ncbi:MAG: glycosyltransferase family A protein [Planctomycetota bacterium]
MLLVLTWTTGLILGITIPLWIVVWIHMGRVIRQQPSVRDGLLLPAPERGWPKVSIIVPAHNEQRVIDRCAASLRWQEYDDLEIIFVLDRCTDDTLTILQKHAAEDDRIVIIENDSCPDDWAGKCNALRIGAERATGEYLLFADADAGFDEKLVRASVALAAERGDALLSLLSTLTVERAFERMAQPVASMSLMKLFPMHRLNGPPGKFRPFANGQFMLFERSWYEKIGGHESVHDALLEDLAFAREMNNAGGKIGVLLADGMLKVSMYGSYEAFHAGWKRIFIEACNRRPNRLRKHGNRLFALGLFLPLLILFAIVCTITNVLVGDIVAAAAIFGLMALTVILQVVSLLRIYRLADAPLVSTLFYPAGCAMVGRIMRNAAADLESRTPVRWGGREYILEPR